MGATLAKVVPFSEGTVLFLDTLRDITSAVGLMSLRPYLRYSVSEVVDENKCPYVDTEVVYGKYAQAGAFDIYMNCAACAEVKWHLDTSIPSQAIGPPSSQDLASTLIAALEFNALAHLRT
ncbi:hypothetical protein D9756_009272 [Leucocoprinus leucothites]|uniref:Uncharacterized protein n=1 Tax=Leucocoprinus leucothites TaxID=201217 RepID=A0A8H5D0S6_9AGAR|nr:hypothetical protein D9756_009272 [Leucoagaricus leucothites]